MNSRNQIYKFICRCFVVSSDISQQLLKVNKKSDFFYYYYSEIKSQMKLRLKKKNGKMLLDRLGKKDANVF